LGAGAHVPIDHWGRDRGLSVRVLEIATEHGAFHGCSLRRSEHARVATTVTPCNHRALREILHPHKIQPLNHALLQLGEACCHFVRSMLCSMSIRATRLDVLLSLGRTRQYDNYCNVPLQGCRAGLLVILSTTHIESWR